VHFYKKLKPLVEHAVLKELAVTCNIICGKLLF